MNLAAVDIINFIAIFQLLVFISFLFRRKTNSHANRILGTFLFVQLLIILDFETLHLHQYVLNAHPHLFLIGTPFILLAAPSFYLYVKSLAFTDFRLKSAHLLHALPLVLAYFLFTFKFYFLSADIKRGFLTGAVPFPESFWAIFNLAVFVQLLSYFLVDLRILKHYRDEIRQQYSSVKEINLSWLSFILYAFIIAWLSSVVVFLSRNYFWKIYDDLQFVNFLAFFCFFNYIFYKGLSKPEIFSGIEERPKYLSSRLTDDEAQTYLSKLHSFMAKEKPYLNPSLTLKELASQISICRVIFHRLLTNVHIRIFTII